MPPHARRRIALRLLPRIRVQPVRDDPRQFVQRLQQLLELGARLVDQLPAPSGRSARSTRVGLET